MYHPVKTMKDFTKSLAGLWSNPRSKNKFYFSADQSNADGEIQVVHHGTEEAIPVHFKFSARGEKIHMTVEGERYKTSLMDVPASALYIKLSPGKTLRLLKR